MTYSVTQSFTYVSNAPQYYTVPAGIYSIFVQAIGASSGVSGSVTPGYGAIVQSTLSVVPGTQLALYIGKQGSNEASNSIGGWNGGGKSYNGCAGGGATDIRNGTYSIAERLVVAGGGGGSYTSGCGTPYGGNGGNPLGSTGGLGTCGGAFGGGGGTLSAGGSTCTNNVITNGTGLVLQGGNSISGGGGGGGGGFILT
eukprot:gene1681-2219_t